MLIIIMIFFFVWFSRLLASTLCSVKLKVFTLDLFFFFTATHQMLECFPPYTTIIRFVTRSVEFRDRHSLRLDSHGIRPGIFSLTISINYKSAKNKRKEIKLGYSILYNCCDLNEMEPNRMRKLHNKYIELCAAFSMLEIVKIVGRIYRTAQIKWSV